MKNKLSPSIIVHSPHVWSNQYWGTHNGVPQQICIGVVADPGNRQIIKCVDVLSILYSNAT